MTSIPKLRILVAPLDWGLGHASRCVVLIRELIRLHQVIIAGSGASLNLLRAEFPQLPYEELPGYNPTYPTRGSMVWIMLKQLPHFAMVIRKEQQEVEKIIQKHQIDCVISDNRYGCRSRKIWSIFITHQSNILMPKRFGWLSPVVRWYNERMMKQFDQCWIPDYPDDHSLAGQLIAFGESFDKNRVLHIGPLSRFNPTSAKAEKRLDLLCVFSGPEPQRSILEKIVVEQLSSFNGRVQIVRGLLPGYQKQKLNTHHAVRDYMTSEELQQAIEASEVVLSRSGYSTVMDLFRMQAKAILIPTPGQTEQEYLAHRLQEKKWAYSVSQKELNIEKAIQACTAIPGFPEVNIGEELLLDAIKKLSFDIKQKKRES